MTRHSDHVVRFKQLDDGDTLTAYLNGELVGMATRDAHGHAGMTLLEDTVEAVARVLSAKVHES